MKRMAPRAQVCALAVQRVSSKGVPTAVRRHRVQLDLRFEAATPIGAGANSALESSDSVAPAAKEYLSSTQKTSYQILQQYDDEPADPSEVDSNGNGDGGKKGGGGHNGGGDGWGPGDSYEGEPVQGIALVLGNAGRELKSLPAGLQLAIKDNRVSSTLLERYLTLEKGVMTRLLLGMQGFLERLLADPSFLAKVGIECGIGIFTKLTAEYQKRESTFAKELDFVAANVMMAIIADFMLVWMPAPTFNLNPRSVSIKNRMTRFFQSCPDNAFQVVQPGMHQFSVLERFGAIVRNGGKLMAVGCCSSLIGVAITNGLLTLRSLLLPNSSGANPPQDILKTSLAYGTYMAVSSNLRYQVVAGILEERGIERIFAGRPQVCTSLSLVIRTANTFVGSLLWVDFVRLCGMQKSTPAVEEDTGPKGKKK